MSEISWEQDHRGVTLCGPWWRLRYDLLLGLFDLTAPPFPRFGVRWARARALYERNGRARRVGSDDGRAENWRVEPVQDPHGEGLRLFVRQSNPRHPTVELAATLYRDSPLLVLELGLHNTLEVPIRVRALEPLEVNPEWGGKVLLGSPVVGVYGAGWQSWSPAGRKEARSHDLRTRYPPLAGPVLDAPPLPPLLAGQFRADLVGALISEEGPVLLAGLLSTADQFGALEADLRRERPRLTFTCATDDLPLAPDERISSERVGLLLARPEEAPLETYGRALGQEMHARVGKTAPTGWCSWTAFYLNLGEEEVLRQVEWLAKRRDLLPVKVVQVDDGWERAVGDWSPNGRFPHGMAWLAEQIREAGFTPGLWLAPLIVHPRSSLVQSHPEWLVQGGRGRPASAGLGWGSLCYGLDVTRPEVQEWLRRLIGTVVAEWGYTYLKLDFLYAGAVVGQRRRPDLSRAQVLRRALEIIREAAGPEAFLLGCGCPLGPAVGLVDGMRVSPDIAPYWSPRWGVLSPFVRNEPTLPAMSNAVRNNLARAWMHRRLWLNDPDALLLRDAGSDLSPAEVRSLTSLVALTGGTWMLGDDLPALEPERQSLAGATLPLHWGRPVVVDLLDGEMPRWVVLPLEGPWGRGWVVGLFNWGGRPADLEADLSALGLPAAGRWHLHEFWSGEVRRVEGRVRFAGVPPHDCRVALLRPAEEEGPQWVGSTLHLLQGVEVRSWERTEEGLELTVDAGRALEGSLLLWWPGREVQAVQVDGGMASVEAAGAGLWRVVLQAERACRVRVRDGGPMFNPGPPPGGGPAPPPGSGPASGRPAVAPAAARPGARG